MKSAAACCQGSLLAGASHRTSSCTKVGKADELGMRNHDLSRAAASYSEFDAGKQSRYVFLLQLEAVKGEGGGD